ncbi:MAG: hypothetical protein HQK96_08550 [Nitrospirae bacterium]|nr:hypothetical protein [Nitrospirota bacterium]
MKRYLKCLVLMVVAAGSLSLLNGCITTTALAPRINVMPAPGKPLDLFQQEVEECKQWATQQVGGPRAVAHAQKSAFMTGMLLGPDASGANAAQANADMQQLYDNAYVQCMYAKGNQVPDLQ